MFPPLSRPNMEDFRNLRNFRVTRITPKFRKFAEQLRARIRESYPWRTRRRKKPPQEPSFGHFMAGFGLTSAILGPILADAGQLSANIGPTLATTGGGAFPRGSCFFHVFLLRGFQHKGFRRNHRNAGFPRTRSFGPTRVVFRPLGGRRRGKI